MGVRTASLFGAMAVLFAAQAQAATVCETTRPDFDAMQSALSAADCTLKRDGAHLFTGGCTDFYMLGARNFQETGDHVVVLLPTGKTESILAAYRDCGLKPARYSTPRLPDNVLVREIAHYDAPENLQIALVGIPEEGTEELIVYKGPRYRFDSVLARVLEARFGSKVLNFDSSTVRIAGIDFVEAADETLIAALKARGASVIEDEGPGTYRATKLSATVGVPGLKTVEVVSFGGRIRTVTYAIPDKGAYETFFLALDEKYGASTRDTYDGCVRRLWDAGGVVILGLYCASKPEDTGFSFISSGLFDVQSKYFKTIEDRKKASNKPSEQSKPTLDTDMF